MNFGDRSGVSRGSLSEFSVPLLLLFRCSPIPKAMAKSGLSRDRLVVILDRSLVVPLTVTRKATVVESDPVFNLAADKMGEQLQYLRKDAAYFH